MYRSHMVRPDAYRKQHCHVVTLPHARGAAGDRKNSPPEAADHRSAAAGGLQADLARAARDVAGEVGWRRARLRRGGGGRGRLSSLRERRQKRARGAGEARRGTRAEGRKSERGERCERGGEGGAMGVRTALEGSPPDPRRTGCPTISPRSTKFISSSATPGRPLFRRFLTCHSVSLEAACARTYFS